MSKKEIHFLDDFSRNSYFLDIDLPNLCPHCHKGILPSVIGNSEITCKDSSKYFTVIFLCPVCNEHFVETYYNVGATTTPIGYKSNTVIDEDVPEKIKILFPKFYSIYCQALTAESYGLTDLIGLGFRKSIEFLIKDFLIKIKNSDTDKISDMSLQKAINEIDDTRIRTLATKTYWLGNDETHYIKKHQDRDYKDMKNFIKALYSYINYELIYLDADSIPKK